MTEECPCCYETNYEKSYDTSGEHLEPTTGFCVGCGFSYSEHIKVSERDQVLMHRLALREEGKWPDWDEIFKCDKVSGHFKTESGEKMKINFRVNDKYPHHTKVALFVNGANCGDLCLKIEEFDIIRELLALGMFQAPHFATLQISVGS